jgi:c-di-GMP-binding flagellar brake protein YcgR
VGRECFLAAQGRTYLVEVRGVAGPTIWLSFPACDYLAAGTGVELSFHDADGAATYHARVLVSPGDLSGGLMIERAEAPTDQQRRRDWRVPADFPVWIRSSGQADKIKGRMVDLTAHGTLIATNYRFDPGEKVELIFQLPQSAVHRLTAQIVYCDLTDETGVNRFGLRFLDVNRRAREALTWFLYDRIQTLYMDELRELYPLPSTSRTAPPPRPRQLAPLGS